jgi:hypothetical protein
MPIGDGVPIVIVNPYVASMALATVDAIAPCPCALGKTPSSDTNAPYG